MAVVELFRALGDPNRLEMVKRLSSDETFTINTVSQGLMITRQGARKHLQILVDSELVLLKPMGRDTRVLLNKAKLDEGRIFMLELERQWEVRLATLRQVVEGD